MRVALLPATYLQYSRRDKAMKQALLEVMRINRICRMVLVTCLGSFALVIFYFQSMLHPGKDGCSVCRLLRGPWSWTGGGGDEEGGGRLPPVVSSSSSS